MITGASISAKSVLPSPLLGLSSTWKLCRKIAALLVRPSPRSARTARMCSFLQKPNKTSLSPSEQNQPRARASGPPAAESRKPHLQHLGSTNCIAARCLLGLNTSQADTRALSANTRALHPHTERISLSSPWKQPGKITSTRMNSVLSEEVDNRP